MNLIGSILFLAFVVTNPPTRSPQNYLMGTNNVSSIYFTNNGSSLTNAIIKISLSVFTNWTGFKFEDKELGYVATNHIATVNYQNQTNSFTLKTTVSEIGRWRKPEPMNYWNIYTNMMITNNMLHGYSWGTVIEVTNILR